MKETVFNRIYSKAPEDTVTLLSTSYHPKVMGATKSEIRKLVYHQQREERYRIYTYIKQDYAECNVTLFSKVLFVACQSSIVLNLLKIHVLDK